MSKFILACGFTALCFVSTANAVLVFQSDFSGTKDWNFVGTGVDQTNIGGTGNFVYSGDASNPVGYVKHDINGATVFPSKAGTVNLSFDIDTTNYDTGASDFNSTWMVDLGFGGNKKGIVNGAGYSFGMGGFNNAGEQRFRTMSSIGFWGGISDGSPTILSAGGAFHVSADITVTDNGADNWTITNTTTVTGATLGSPHVITSSTTQTWASYNGLQDIDDIKVGYNKEFGGAAFGTGDSFSIDNIELSFASVPEPSSFLFLGSVSLLAFYKNRRVRS